MSQKKTSPNSNREYYYHNSGQCITIPLSQFCSDEKYYGYSISCIYKFNKELEKYMVSMWLMRNDVRDKFRIQNQKIDTQPLSGDKYTIRDNICKVVRYAMQHHYFDNYIDSYEYTYKCFNIGDELTSKGGVATVV